MARRSSPSGRCSAAPASRLGRKAATGSVIGLRRVHRHVGVPQQVGGGSAVGATPKLARRQQVAVDPSGRRRAWRARPAPGSAAGGSQSGRRTTNSSPPSRATRRVLRSGVGQARGDRGRSTSPTWWPRVSLISLKRSRSRSRHGDRRTGRDGRVDLVDECGPVEQPGQGVVPRAVAQLPLCHPAELHLRLELVGSALAEDHHQQVGEGQDQCDVVHSGRSAAPGAPRRRWPRRTRR